MNHIEQGELQAYLDDEVLLGKRAQIDLHIKSCEACATELNGLRAASAMFATALRGADAHAPTSSAFASVSAARGNGRLNRFAFSRAALSRAAILLIGCAALASAAIPGSPVRGWLTTALRTIGIAPQAETRTAPHSAPASAPAPAPGMDVATSPAGLSIEPVDGRVRIRLTNVDAATEIHVRLIEGDRALLQATGTAAKAHFRTGAGSLELIGVGKGEITIDLPRNARDARVEVDGKVLYPKSNDAIHQ